MSWLETARNAATRYLGGSDRVKEALELAEERSPGDIGGVDKAEEGDAIDAAAPKIGTGQRLHFQFARVELNSLL